MSLERDFGIWGGFFLRWMSRMGILGMGFCMSGRVGERVEDGWVPNDGCGVASLRTG